MLLQTIWMDFRGEHDSKLVLIGDPQMEGSRRIEHEGLYGRISVFMNDVYYKHIVSNILKYAKPTHIFVLGDIFSSQYIGDSEFDQRVARFNSIFSHSSILSQNTKLINITGNHDIGYANEVSRRRIERFENAFGKINGKYYASGHLFVTVNSMNLDASSDKELSNESWEHLYSVSQEAEEKEMPIILFMHIPLWKPEGSCVDSPTIVYDSNGNVKDQMMLSEETSSIILNKIKPKFIFTGHDHFGCIFKHNGYTTEYTIRSIMGEFGGYIGIFEIKGLTDQLMNFRYKYYSSSFVIMYVITAAIVLFVTWIVLFALLFAALVVKYNLLKKERKEKEENNENNFKYREDVESFTFNE